MRWKPTSARGSRVAQAGMTREESIWRDRVSTMSLLGSRTAFMFWFLLRHEYRGQGAGADSRWADSGGTIRSSQIFITVKREAKGY